MDNWLDDFSHPKLDTPEVQESAKNTLKKFASKDDVVISYIELEKSSSKPFKLPQSLDKLPNEVRGDFTKQARKVLGIEDAVNDDTIKQVNFKKGLSDGKKANEQIVQKLTEFAVKKGFSLSQVQDLVEMINATGTELVASANADMERTNKEILEKSNQVLTQYYGADRLKENAELLRRAMKDHVGLSNEEYESVATDFMDDGWIFKHPALTKVLMDKIAPLAKEGNTETRGLDENQKKKKGTLADEGFEKTLDAIPALKKI